MYSSMGLRRVALFLLALAILAGMAGGAALRPALAQASEVDELIALINALRTSRGLAPYRVDPGLMAMAQAHSEYQASISTSTHQHSDGQDPPDLGVVENVAGGDLDYLDPQAAVYEIWADPVHMRAMTGYASGAMGVGIADDGTTKYYTLEVRPGDAATPAGSPGPDGAPPGATTPVPLVPLVTMTPRADGTIVHVVGYGQTLWAIALAYGIRVDQIRAWNNLAEGSSEIYAGQWLLVRPASLAPPTATAGNPAPTVTPATASPTGTAPATWGAPAGQVTLEGQELLAEPENPAGEAAPGGGPPAREEAGLLLPLIAGASILAGCGLLAGLVHARRVRRGSSRRSVPGA